MNGPTRLRCKLQSMTPINFCKVSSARLPSRVTTGQAFQLQPAVLIAKCYLDYSDVYVDKLETGFITWTSSLKGYRVVSGSASPFTWEHASQPALQAMSAVLLQGNYFAQLALLWGQESSRGTANPEMRLDNAAFMKTLGQYLSSM